MVSEPRGEASGEEEHIDVCEEERTEEKTSPNQFNQEMASSELTNGSAEEAKPGQSESEERVFVRNLYQFMKERGTPIERIPHLGFKQINLWKIFKAVEILGGYESVTTRRLWKNVYDELGGSPGSTSAATCTRRHYERLVLPYERHRRGEEDKPLPPSKPRKQYKRNEEGKGKTESKKRRRTDGDDPEEIVRGSHPCERGVCSHSGPWPVSSEHSDGNQVSPQDMCLREKPLLQPLVPALVISPLEKKKRLAQASLSVAPPAGLEDGTEPERPSVIHLSHSSIPSGRASHNSDGSPLPLSSPSSSRSPSPSSVSSEDCVAVPTQKTTALEAEKQKPARFGALPESGARVCQPLPFVPYPSPKDASSLSRPLHHNFLNVSATHPDKTQRYPALRIPVSTSLGSQYWVPSTSSFTKVVPRSCDYWSGSVQSLYKPHIPNSKRPSSAEAYVKKIPSPVRFIERKDKSKMVVPKPMPTQQYLVHQTGLPSLSYVLPGLERPRVQALDQMKALPLQPVLFPHLNIPPSQTHPTHSLQGPFPGPYEPTLRPYPYSVPVWHSPGGYSMATLQPY
ncbi:AT-rich interactive domain-containing protein 5A isoform X2 [Neoarius graeffei]|uniref:AT-rich interactive domain-containing protein 5A isoform X2 n=1 Tax=Neoarius graeffei TaxID=443677 RepID=UPI00298BFDBC|nr:AT-rich interactive domain-containing protein 5A isoform X2 [Neoarius graeffei]